MLARRFNTGWADGKYSMIAGHIDGKETVSAALIREAKEECGIDIKTKAVKVLHTMHRCSENDVEYIDFFASASVWEGVPGIMEPDKCDDVRWFLLDQLPTNLLPHVRQAIDCIERGITYSEFGWDE